MYQSEFFYGPAPKPQLLFQPMVTSVFKILADDSYCHYCDNEEKMTHPEQTVSFIRTTDGSGKLYLSNRSFCLNEGDCVLVRFHDIIKYKATGSVWGYRWVNFIPACDGEAYELNKIYTIDDSEQEHTAFKRLLDGGKVHSKNPNYINMLFLNYFYTVMLENCCAQDESQTQTPATQADEICAYIMQKLYTKITIGEVAAFFKLSPRRLHQIFVKELGISPKQYILKKKMEEGYRLLVQTSAPIHKIAYSLGFSSPYHFTNEFKKTFHQSPSTVRKTQDK